MNESDDLTFARFAERFARIEHLIPDPPATRSVSAISAINRGSRRLSLSGAAGLIGVVLVLVVAAGLAFIGAPGPSPSPSGVLSADAATAIAISQVASTTPVRVLSVRLSIYGAEDVGSAVDADTPVWAVVLAGTFSPPSCGPYTATPHPCPPPATTALVLIDARSGAFIESVMPAPSASPTTTPDVAAWYPDGLPMTIGGEKVYRPLEVVPELHPTGPILVGGWDFGPLFTSCPAQIVGASNPPCPIYEGLSEVRGGPNVLAVRWDAPFQNTAPAVVIRAELVPMDACTSIPPGGCPTHPTLHALGYVWQGEPSPPTPSGATASPPSPEGVGAACTAGQLVVGTATFGYGFGVLGTTSVFITERLQNVGGDCVVNLPTSIEVASATGPFRTVRVVDAGTADATGGYTPTMSARILSGGSVSIVIGAWWWTGVQPDGGTPLPSPACVSSITDVTRIAFPMAAGAVMLDLPTVLRQVCSSPPSISLTIGHG